VRLPVRSRPVLDCETSSAQAARAHLGSRIINNVDLNTFEPVDAVHPRALDPHLAFARHAERGEKSDSGCKVVDDDADVVQSLDNDDVTDVVLTKVERHWPEICSGSNTWGVRFFGNTDQFFCVVGVDKFMPLPLV
jgi:hypothetical protein